MPNEDNKCNLTYYIVYLHYNLVDINNNLDKNV